MPSGSVFNQAVYRLQYCVHSGFAGTVGIFAASDVSEMHCSYEW